MSVDQPGSGLAITRVFIGVFFVFESLSKIHWFTHTSLLTGQLTRWLQTVGAGSNSGWYLQHIAIPGAPLFARLVPLGEFCAGLALVFGVWTRVVAFVAFFMALNFHFASGVLFSYSFLTNGYGLPVLGSTLGLVVGGGRLPWSLRH